MRVVIGKAIRPSADKVSASHWCDRAATVATCLLSMQAARFVPCPTSFQSCTSSMLNHQLQVSISSMHGLLPASIASPHQFPEHILVVCDCVGQAHQQDLHQRLASLVHAFNLACETVASPSGTKHFHKCTHREQQNKTMHTTMQ